jgi:predicted metalloprotease with PDZ domain
MEWASSGLQTTLRLPQWRPGRYEQGNFTRNLVALQVKSTAVALDNPGSSAHIPITKTTASEWVLRHEPDATLEIEYSYLANQPDAGACWVDQELLYVNPVHCCLYLPGHEHEPCTLHVDTGAGAGQRQVAIALPTDSEHRYTATSFHELVDSPFLVSSRLHEIHWSAEGVNFVLWIHGSKFPDGHERSRILRDFQAFCSEQILTMGSFPVDTFHFMLLALPYSFYHGVEHLRSTVLALGPQEQLWTTLYKELMGVASHELFHAWNIKSFRPDALQTYRYEGLMFSELGYVYEGFTTYYGDLFLARCGVLSFEEYLDEVNAYLLRHTMNYGRYNHGLHESSVDTWVDGYSSLQSAPHRRVSIYAEGMLQALHLDLTIRHYSHHTLSLDDMMRYLWQTHRSNPQQGYQEQDLQAWCEQHLPAACDWALYFQEHYARPMSLETHLGTMIRTVGCEMILGPCEDAIKRYMGLQMLWNKGLPTVDHTVPGSPAAMAGLGPGDRWLAWQIVDHVLPTTVESRPIMLDQDAITELRIPEDPTNLQAKARKILGETLVRELGVPNTANKWLDANPDPNSVALEAKQALAVLHINNLGHCSIAWLMGLGGVEFYGHYKIAPDEKATAEQMANRAAWMGSMTL